jgi:outer membrane protein OmpA-like peptidoglycan-associated protein
MKKIILFFTVMLPCMAVAQEQFTVYFDFDADKANTTSGRRLSNWMEAHKDIEVVQVLGYADSTGSADYNVDLSQRRANYVVRQLKQANVIVANEAEVKGFGETKAFSDNKATDRIVVIHYNQIVEPKEAALTDAVKTASIGDKLRLPNLNFYNFSDVVLPESKHVLKELLDIMTKNPNLIIDIHGYICCEPVEKEQISLKRAKAVYNYLVKNGISKNRISYKGFGSTEPIYALPEKTEQQKIVNRRVEIEIVNN